MNKLISFLICFLSSIMIGNISAYASLDPLLSLNDNTGLEVLTKEGAQQVKSGSLIDNIVDEIYKWGNGSRENIERTKTAQNKTTMEPGWDTVRSGQMQPDEFKRLIRKKLEEKLSNLPIPQANSK